MSTLPLSPSEFTPHTFADVPSALTERARKIRAQIARAELAQDAEPIDTTIRAIRALGDLLRSSDSTAEDMAIEAAQSGRAAYWTSGQYHNMAAVRLARRANSDMSLEDAIAECVIEGVEAASVFALLDTLIPLNPLARNALTAARTSAALQLALAVRKIEQREYAQAAE